MYIGVNWLVVAAAASSLYIALWLLRLLSPEVQLEMCWKWAACLIAWQPHWRTAVCLIDSASGCYQHVMFVHLFDFQLLLWLSARVLVWFAPQFASLHCDLTLFAFVSLALPFKHTHAYTRSCVYVKLSLPLCLNIVFQTNKYFQMSWTLNMAERSTCHMVGNTRLNGFVCRGDIIN